MTGGPSAGGTADSRKIADLGLLSTAQTAAQQAWLAAVWAGGAASAVAAWEAYFRRARELLQVALWFEQRWPPVLPLTDLADPLVQALRQRADHAAAAADAELAAAAVRARTLIVVPHGALHVLPWAGLTLNGRWLVERQAQDPDARLVLVAHSMGGLVARYFLEVLGGWRQTRMLITFGTPFRGSLNAVGFLANGMTKAGGLVDLTEVLRSCTSVYQLLPIYPCLDPGDGRLVRLMELSVSVPGIEPDRVAAARAFHREIEEAVARNRQEADYIERGYSLLRVVGAEQPTMQSARYVDGRVTLLPTRRRSSPARVMRRCRTPTGSLPSSSGCSRRVASTASGAGDRTPPWPSTSRTPTPRTCRCGCASRTTRPAVSATRLLQV